MREVSKDEWFDAYKSAFGDIPVIVRDDSLMMSKGYVDGKIFNMIRDGDEIKFYIKE